MRIKGSHALTWRERFGWRQPPPTSRHGLRSVPHPPWRLVARLAAPKGIPDAQEIDARTAAGVASRWARIWWAASVTTVLLTMLPWVAGVQRWQCGALGNHRNTSIIPASREWSPPKPQIASLIGVAAPGSSAGAPGTGEIAGRTCSFPERGPVGPCAAAWIAGPSPLRHWPVYGYFSGGCFRVVDRPLRAVHAPLMYNSAFRLVTVASRGAGREIANRIDRCAVASSKGDILPAEPQ